MDRYVRAERTSVDHLLRINQRREVETDDIHMQFDSIAVLNHGANDGILNLPVMEVHADFVADLNCRVFSGFLWAGTRAIYVIRWPQVKGRLSAKERINLTWSRVGKVAKWSPHKSPHSRVFRRNRGREISH